MVRCPQCDVEMREVCAPANPGQLIILDQCTKCGGIWCDKWELLPISPDEAATIDSIDVAQLRASIDAPGNKETFCPRCTARLVVAHDPALPADLQLCRCMKCDGIWLNRGQLSRFKAYQRRKRQSRLGADAQAALTRIMHDPQTWKVTGTNGIFAYPQAAADDPPTVGQSIKKSAPLILQTLARLLLGI